MTHKIDPMFVRCVKEEIADSETVTILVPSRRHIPAYEAVFSDEELDSITFRVAGGDRP